MLSRSFWFGWVRGLSYLQPMANLTLSIYQMYPNVLKTNASPAPDHLSMNRSSTKIDVVEDVELGQVQRWVRKYTIDTQTGCFSSKIFGSSTSTICTILHYKEKPWKTHKNHPPPKCSHNPMTSPPLFCTKKAREIGALTIATQNQSVSGTSQSCFQQKTFKHKNFRIRYLNLLTDRNAPNDFSKHKDFARSKGDFDSMISNYRLQEKTTRLNELANERSIRNKMQNSLGLSMLMFLLHTFLKLNNSPLKNDDWKSTFFLGR